jgi:hypothetical protein
VRVGIFTRHALEGFATDQPAPVDVDEYRARGEPHGVFPPFSVVTPDQAVAVVQKAVSGLPAAAVYFYETFAGLPSALAAEHIRLLAEAVRPALQ